MMKTAAIFTFQWSDNFGTLFQALALQEALRENGVRATIVPLHPKESKGIKRYVGRTPRVTYKKLYERFFSGNENRHSVFEPFRHRYFKYAFERAIDFEEALQIQYPYDILVFGSDNIWSGEVIPPGSASARVFFATGIEHPHKVSYAASCCGNLAVNPLRSEIVRDIAEGRFESISCREESTVEVLRAAGLGAEIVPDPTLLLDAGEWETFAECIPGERYDCIWGYDLGHSLGNPIRKVCEKLASGDEVALCCPNSWRTSPVHPSPGEWLAYIKNARCVVTNSFHGVVFSIVFQRPFLFVPVVGGKSNINCRAISFLKRMGLTARILSDSDDIQMKMACKIEWREVHAKLYEFRAIGMSYLKRVFS